nr:hypothetical protein [Desulfacinum infernum]
MDIGTSGPLPRPSGNSKWRKLAHSQIIARIEPRRKSSLVKFHRYQHTPVEAGSTGQEALEVVDGREAGLGIVEGQELAVHGPPAAAWDVVLPELGVCGACGELRGQARLCGHVGERVGGAVGQDVRLGHIQDRYVGRELVQATSDDKAVDLRVSGIALKGSMGNRHESPDCGLGEEDLGLSLSELKRLRNLIIRRTPQEG